MDDDVDADFDLDPARVEEDFARFDAQCAISRTRMSSGGGLDQLAAVTRVLSRLRWILVHMIEEYARHNGHADLLREAIDGAVGE